MTFLADVNVLVDLALDRQPWSGDAKRLFDTAADRGITVFATAVTLPTLFYVVRKLSDAATAFAAIDRTLAGAEIGEVGRAAILAARAMPGRDFEDNVQITCGVAAGVDVIVTRDPSDFAHSPVRAMSPRELLAALASQP